MRINKVLVIGAGVMGASVALNLAIYGHPVVLKDIHESQIGKAKDNIIKEFKLWQLMKRVKWTKTIDDVLAQISFTLDFPNEKDFGIVIENVDEDWSVKKNVYRTLEELSLHKNTIYAANTSCISITKIAALLPDPSKVLGMHFMNPVPLKATVEVVKGYYTDEATIANANSFLTNLDKNPVVVNDYPGFVANRLSHLFMNEAAYLVQDQVANPKEIDSIFKNGYGHKMGPLETADLIGLDTVVNSLKVLYDSYQDSKFRCCPLLQKMVDAGMLGKKSGKGFYQYQLH